MIFSILEIFPNSVKKETPMQTFQGTLFDLPAVELYQYLLLVKPSSEVEQQIWLVKKEFSTQFQYADALFSKPHVSIIGLVSNGKTEERDINLLRDLTLQFSGFVVDINGFDGFPSHTIFAKVSNEQGILENYMKAVRFSFGIKIRNLVPHLTIAKGLPKEVYAVAHPVYSSKSFQASFQCNSVILLKRKYETGKFVLVEEFNFAKTPIYRD